jgi:hypothetical protein
VARCELVSGDSFRAIGTWDLPESPVVGCTLEVEDATFVVRQILVFSALRTTYDAVVIVEPRRSPESPR